MVRPLVPLADRLWSRIDADGDCWLWTGALTGLGYGALGRGRTGDGNVYAHRAAWELLVGEIPKGYVLRHLCQVPACCNPDHIQPMHRGRLLKQNQKRAESR